MKREFLQLAHVYEVSKTSIGSWFMSEKLDGMRAFWDGGISRGLYAADVPYANTEKDSRLLVQPKATGLWTRYGKTIQAPEWWLDMLPAIPLDGELYLGRGKFQSLVSITKSLTGTDWRSVRFMIFDSPPLHVVLGDGKMDNSNFKKQFSGCLDKMSRHRKGWFNERLRPETWDFRGVMRWIGNTIGQYNNVFQIHTQTELPSMSGKAQEVIMEKLEEITSAGGEGLMLRHPISPWVPERTRTLLKVKAFNDAEGTVTGYIWGRETDRGSKLLGLMGALVVDFQGKRLELSGFTHAEREMRITSTDESALYIGIEHPGEVVQGCYNPQFPIGTKVTFRYRELTDAGIPKEARYWRKHTSF